MGSALDKESVNNVDQKVEQMSSLTHSIESGHNWRHSRNISSFDGVLVKGSSTKARQHDEFFILLQLFQAMTVQFGNVNSVAVLLLFERY